MPAQGERMEKRELIEHENSHGEDEWLEKEGEGEWLEMKRPFSKISK